MKNSVIVLKGDNKAQRQQMTAHRYLWDCEQDRLDEIQAHKNAWVGGLAAMVIVFGLSGLIQ